MNYKSVIYSEYLSDADMQAVVSDEALIKKMIEFEVELAQAQGELGLIPSMTKEEIVKTLKYANVKPSELSKGTLQNGVPVIPFLQLVQRDLSEEGKKYLHYGVTS
jgi:adenylosuccinate lyase